MRYIQADWPVAPMEPVRRAEPFDDQNTLFQVKWDGVRALAYAYPGSGVRLFNRRLRERTAQYPELVEALSGLPAGTVLDGEIIAPDADGKPDFPRVLRRDLVASPAKIKRAADAVPVRYMAFDLLWLDGQTLCPLPLTERFAALDALTLDSKLVHRVESVPQAGRALFAAVQAEGLEGVVAKKMGSTYAVGKKTDAWQKIKCIRRQKAVVGGYLQEDPARIRSLLIGLPREDGSLDYIGLAGSGLTQAQLRALKELLSGIPGPCPFGRVPAVPGARWVQPVLPVEVKFLEYTAGGVMRAPVITGFPEELK